MTPMVTGPKNPLAFSTLGTPGLPMSEVARIAVRYGFSGVELRATSSEPVPSDGRTPSC